jgi:hypothetical protein
MTGYWAAKAAPRGGLRLVPCVGLGGDASLPSLFDPFVSSLSPVVAVHEGATGSPSPLSHGPHLTLEGLFDNMALTLWAMELVDTLTPSQEAQVRACPRLLFSYQPAVPLAARGTAHADPVCSPFFPSKLRPGFHRASGEKGYLRVTLGTVLGHEGKRKPVHEYAHRLVAAATLGADWHTLLGRPTRATHRFEVSHMCGNAWCLCPTHLKVVDHPLDNTIELPHLRPMSLT